MAVAIPISCLIRHCDPFGECNPWGAPNFSREAVSRAIGEQRFESRPGGTDHAARVAYLVAYPAEDPIDIDVGVPSLGCFPNWLVEDGNHRLAAAIYSGSHTIMARIQGDIAHAFKLFGVDCSDDEDDESNLACNARMRPA